VKSSLQFLRDCFHLLLSLYPQEYREEYGEELQKKKKKKRLQTNMIPKGALPSLEFSS